MLRLMSLLHMWLSLRLLDVRGICIGDTNLGLVSRGMGLKNHDTG